jgi:hypothetical protein
VIAKQETITQSEITKSEIVLIVPLGRYEAKVEDYDSAD